MEPKFKLVDFQQNDFKMGPKYIKTYLLLTYSYIWNLRSLST